MLTKKGKEWALSCVAVSAAILMGTSTTVRADTNTNTNTASVSSTSDSAGSDAMNSSDSNETNNSDTVVIQSAQVTSATPESVNDAVSDGGHVSDDFTNESQNQLGYASNFHIFANEATLNTHTNGNVAVGDFYGNVNFGTNVTANGGVDKEISYIQRPHNISSSSFVTSGENRDNKVVFGADNDIDISNPNRPAINNTNLDHINAGEIYQDKDGVYIDVANYLDNFLSNKSANLTTLTPQVSVKNSDFPDQNQRVINLEDYETTSDNKIVIDLDPSVLQSGTPLTIAGLSKDSGGTNIIINVDTKGQDPYDINSQIKLIYNDGSANYTERPNQETEYFDDNHLLWNFYDSTATDNLYAGQINVDRPFQGSVLAPKATVVVNQNLDGNIVADKVKVNAETHRWDFQNDSDIETEYDKPVTIPGELPELPGEEDNDGSNIKHPDEEEDEDIDPDTGELVDEDNGGGDDNIIDVDNGSNEDDVATDSKDSEGVTDESIVHGGSEGTSSNSSDNETSSEDNLSDGLLSDVIGNNKDESQTPKVNNNSGLLPQTSETNGILITIVGLIALAFGLILKATHIKKEN
ncbi:LPXTG cell wall anchor domain-containing protein [Companilactobacillus nuruki]|uniref:Surface protein n=1 Tax=Companilactobacillus nuruki TaxID=1993540 RepID=A0A2N7AS25_9LACO|nr:LPXTG cell wall anchor domain-containing protein [Companilactobacillus nuruki]PMD68147.1 Surface protein [Companilactobacillus nuruki]